MSRTFIVILFLHYRLTGPLSLRFYDEDDLIYTTSYKVEFETGDYAVFFASWIVISILELFRMVWSNIWQSGETCSSVTITESQLFELITIKHERYFVFQYSKIGILHLRVVDTFVADYFIVKAIKLFGLRGFPKKYLETIGISLV